MFNFQIRWTGKNVYLIYSEIFIFVITFQTKQNYSKQKVKEQKFSHLKNDPYKNHQV